MISCVFLALAGIERQSVLRFAEVFFANKFIENRNLPAEILTRCHYFTLDNKDLFLKCYSLALRVAK